jgi:TRAP-type C4-dicarboxylate transport system permease large subunit/TRAP-type C4-dicarboxylate transport system permease small subunit
MISSALITGSSLILRYSAAITWDGEDVIAILVTWVLLLGLPTVVESRMSKAKATWAVRIGIVVQILLFMVLAVSGSVLAIQSAPESHMTLGISNAWVIAALPIGCTLTCFVLLSRLCDIPCRASSDDDLSSAEMHSIGAPGLLLIAAACIAILFGFDLLPRLVMRAFSGSETIVIAMMAMAGELARVTNSELRIRRLVQSIFAGTRWAPVSAPILASALQGPVLLRSGRSIEGEVAREASEMLGIMESQGVDRGSAWNALAIAEACALLLPPSFLAVIAATMLFSESVIRLWLSMVVPGVVLTAVLVFVAPVISARKNNQMHPAPKLKKSRVYQIWRDLEGMAFLFAPLLILSAASIGVATISEAAGWIALQGFFFAFVQPVRPRFKDILTALRRSVIVAADLVFAVAAAGATTFVLLRLGWGSAAAPSLATTILCGLLLPALISFFFGVPIALVLSSAFLPLIGTVVDVPIGVSLIKFLLLMFAALLGGTIRVCLLSPSSLGLTLTTTRIRSVSIWVLPLLLLWVVVWFSPGIITWLPDRLF